MAYYYVKSGGTATGDGGRYASQQTGTWATAFTATSEYYDSIDAACDATTSPTAGDFILISDVSAESAGSVIWNHSAATDSEALKIVCVDDGAIDTSEIAASALETFSGYLFTGNNSVSMYGLHLKIGDYFAPASNLSSSSLTHLSNCTIETTSGDAIQLCKGNHTIVYWHNCDFVLDSSSKFQMHEGRACVIGGKVTAASGLSNLLPYGSFANGSGDPELVMYGVDLSDVDGNLISASGSLLRSFRIRMERCQTHASLTKVSGQLYWGQRLEMINCASSSAAAEYQFYINEANNIVQEDTSKYRDGSTAFPDSSQKVSYKITTDNIVGVSMPFVFDLPPHIYAALSSTSTDTVRMYLLSADSLDDGDIWADLIYPDGTTKQVANMYSSVTNAFDPMRTPGSLSTNTESWTGRTTENRYHIDLDTSGDAGADSLPLIRVYVGKPSATMYLCSTPELV